LYSSFGGGERSFAVAEYIFTAAERTFAVAE